MVDKYNLISITIKNFRGFSDVEIDFTEKNKPREIMTFFGHQGCGKSTIIFAIQWCAYGTDLKSKKQKLSRANLYPDIWDGDQKDAISVTMRFRDSINPSITNKDIVCKRMLLADRDRDDIEVFVGEKKSDKFESKDYFSQIFGSIPSISDGVMWVVRTEEMAKMAQTITKSKDSESYFLNFMNLNVPHDGLKELFKTKTNAIKKIMPKGAGVTQKHLVYIETEIRGVEIKIEKANEIIRDLALKKREFKPTANDETISEHGTDYSEAKQELSIAESELNAVRIKRLEIPDLITTLLAAKLKKEDVKIKKNFDAAKFEWPAIADYLENTNLFPTNTITQIREIGEGVGYDTTSLINSSKSINDWLIRIKNLQGARTEYNRCSSIIDDYHYRGIDENSTAVASSKIKKAKEIREAMRLKFEDIKMFKEELEGYETERDGVEHEIAKLATNKSRLFQLRKEKKVVDALIKTINDSNKEYENKMFDEMIFSIKDYWKRIDQIGTYRPILISEPKSQIALERISDGRVRYIDIDDGTGTAAGGEEQLLLVCTCLAVSATSGAKMPIILDDCFTVVDKPSREALVNTVAEDFQNMIFVTNDVDKAKLLKNSQGVLKLDWPETLGSSINPKNLLNWHTWMSWGDING